ncbi:MAG: tripartite tricarboxylate transporter permease [Alphaproteobacteria bacterium]|nr:tripartite tricarboxylate transporter permease [Alphaproteobacteria bacterium]
MDLFSNLALGASVALSVNSLGYAFLGCMVGTLIGVLPGIGPVSTIAMLIPLTYQLQPTDGLIMIAGIYYGAQYGGSTTAILLNVPGETSSIVTCLDGHPMAKQGRAGPALVVSALGSFFAGMVGIVLTAMLALPLAYVGASFGAPEYFALMVLGLIGAVVLAQGSPIKAVAMVAVGVLMGLVGIDIDTAVWRFTFGITDLADGLDFVPVAVGLFGIADVIWQLCKSEGSLGAMAKIGSWLPTREDVRRAVPASIRGTIVGSLMGILPGGGAGLASFASYIIEKKIARDPSRFGQGAIEGVAGPESANNAAAQTNFIPMLTLGIPANALMAMMMGALTIHGIQPGPHLLTLNAKVFWGLVVSMFVGNVMLLIINLPLIKIWVSFLRIPYSAIYVGILVFSVVGVYTVNNNILDVLFTIFFGVIGVLLYRFKFEPAPLLLGFVLGKLMETNFRKAMIQSGGDFMIFVERPVALGLLIVALGLLLMLLSPTFFRKRKEMFAE